MCAMHSTLLARGSVVLAVLLAFATFARTVWSEDPAAPAARTVILLRHAEKATDGDARDPHLSEAGKKRAEALARLLSKAGATKLYSSEYQRAKETLAPLAAAAGVEVQAIGAAKSADLVTELQKLPAGGVAVVAGHSNTVPAIAKALGATIQGLDAKGYLDEASFDRLFLVTLPPAGAKAAPTLVELRYGD
jgi:phosphohistidine phosphatase SixA